MSGYAVFVSRTAQKQITSLPGNVRQRVRRAVDQLSDEPKPPGGKALDLTGLPASGVEAYRLRLDKWRIVYTVTPDERIVDVLAVRQRPPYDYADLGDLLADVK